MAHSPPVVQAVCPPGTASEFRCSSRPPLPYLGTLGSGWVCALERQNQPGLCLPVSRLYQLPQLPAESMALGMSILTRKLLMMGQVLVHLMAP